MTPFLAIDAGNSSAKAAVWDGARWSETLRLHYGAPSEWAERLGAIADAGTPSGLSSVVPAQTEALVAAVLSATGRAPERISARLALPFAMAYRTPETLGADRIAAATAAWHLGGGRPVIALDAGTALTLDAVDVRQGRPVYLGGAIAPGADLMLRALARGTGALPDVALSDDAPSIGTSTTEAIRSGTWTMFAGGTARLLARASAALAAPPLVVATGGWAERLARDGLAIDLLRPSLVLDGVRDLCATRG